MSKSPFHTGKQGLTYRSKERVWPTGCRLLNTAIGVFDPITKLPGIPAATIMEVFGPNASLKTALWESLAANIHRLDPKARVLAIMGEEPEYSRFASVGIDIERIDCWTYYNPNDPGNIMSAEEGLDLAVEAVSDPEAPYALVVVDSIKSLTSEGQIFTKNGELESLAKTEPVAARARLVNKFIGRYVAANKCRAILFCTNQKTESPSQNFTVGLNMRSETTGGREKEHACKLRIKCDSTVPDQTDKPEEQGMFKNKIYNRIKPIYYLQKNKYGYPFRTVISEFSLDEKRYLNENNCLAVAEFMGLVERKGNSHWVLDGKTIQGKEAARAFLRDNKEYQDKLWKEIDSRHEEFFRSATKKSAKSALDDED